MLRKTLGAMIIFPLFLSCTPSGSGPGSAPSQPQGSSEEASTVKGAGTMQVKGRFIHTVLFWLKASAGEVERRQLIEDCKSYLAPIASVRYFAVGAPAGTPREVVDNSYQVGLVVHFDDVAGHDFYQADEKHIQFIERNQEHWERVQVYDIVSD